MKQKTFHYLKAVFWYILSIIISCINDGITKYIGLVVSIWQISFFRFFFSLITLLPIVFFYREKQIRTQNGTLHIVRGGILFIAMGLWIYGMTKVPIVVVTIINFVMPLFVLVLARIWLKEKVTWKVWGITLLAFIGIILTLECYTYSFSYASLYLIGSACLFSLLDIINKEYVHQEPILAMLFYPTCIAGALTAIPVYYFWSPMAIYHFVWLGILGIGSNLILYCLLQAFRYTTISLLAPWKYLELVLSAAVGYFFFQEIPKLSSWVGGLMIIFCIFFITWSHHQKHRS